ncbi:hypothetical protein DFH07DRAFT_233545 [Mycena maculata]|uniref:Uncharacterized protein n=1 Tax=Mycena maculata TaxID=230809 RepID=A0AAD7HS55_9AGAR|nr:hypothetical protein DFH07DRAFT_233545 [Mycena maculata]
MLSLPLDLEREIFECTIRASPDDIGLRLRLSLVAWRVYTWVGAVIYENTSLLIPRDVERVLRLTHSMGPNFLAATVKTLCLGSRCAPYTRIASDETEPRLPDTTNVSRLLAECGGTRKLACYINFSYDDLPILDSIAQLHLCTLSLKLQYFNCLRERHPRSPWLIDLTHLELVYWGDRWAPNGPEHPLPASALSHLPSLTHIALIWGNDTIQESATRTLRADVCTILATCPLLRMLVIVVGDVDNEHPIYSRRAIFARHIQVQQDRRIVVTIAPTSDKNWTDIWVTAEGLAARNHDVSHYGRDLARM